MRGSISLKIKEFNSNRLPEILKKKYKAMRKDKYSFFRGTAHLYFEDLIKESAFSISPNVWLCGDMHLKNFGSYKGEDKIYFNVNDFDESVVGPCLYDIARMISSIYAASDSLSLSDEEIMELTQLFTETYFNVLEEGQIRVLEDTTANGLIKKLILDVDARKKKTFLEKRTALVNGEMQLRINRNRFRAVHKKEALIKEIKTHFQNSEALNKYKVLDLVFRVAGLSSLGIKRYLALVTENNDALVHRLIDIKEAMSPCLLKHLDAEQPVWDNDAERIIEIQKRIQHHPPSLLHVLKLDGNSFVIKELHHRDDTIDFERHKGKVKKIKNVLVNMASIYAWGNLRSAGRQGSATADELIDFAKNKKNTVAVLVKYAKSYSETMNTYYERFCDDCDKGFFKIIN